MKKKNKLKRIDRAIIFSMFAFLFLFNNKVDNDLHNNVRLYDNTTDFELDDLYNFIYSSKNLSKEEKDYLYNSKFLDDVLESVNKSDYMKELYYNRFKNISVKSFHDEENHITLGYYNETEPNALYVRDYDCLNEKNEDVLSHEFIHLCQEISEYNLIIESCAEIISNEYYDNSPIDSYQSQVLLTKKFIEIIGPDPIWRYCFTGDFSLIEKEVKPYFSDVDYKAFLDCLSFDYDDIETNKIKFKIMNDLLGKLYENKYNDDINNDLVISLINKGDLSLVRYYFNDEYINYSNSYYLDYDKGEYINMSYEEAIDRGLLYVSAIYKEKISNEKALNMIDEGYISISRDIDLINSNIILISRTDSAGKTYISYLKDGIKYDKVDVDELVRQGIINVTYYKVDYKLLTSSQYANKDYREGSDLHFSHSSDTLLYDDYVYGFVPKKVYLPTIKDSFEPSTVVRQKVLEKRKIH